jgi:hypothetical protein
MLVLLACTAATASAHAPGFVEAGEPAVIPDGTVSSAIYGRLERGGERRVVRVRLKPGETLAVELLIPDRSPERGLSAAELPRITVRTPRGPRSMRNNLRVRFDESFSNASYIRLGAMRTRVRGGEYRVVITGASRARFCLVVGQREVFGPDVVANLPESLDRIRTWYRTP